MVRAAKETCTVNVVWIDSLINTDKTLSHFLVFFTLHTCAKLHLDIQESTGYKEIPYVHACIGTPTHITLLSVCLTLIFPFFILNFCVC